MLTAEMNERITHVDPGTPMGELLRRYWHPVAGVAELKDRSTLKVRMLGEDLALYRDGSGTYGLLAENCPHRRVSLVYGVPEDEGIRCPYHGWLYDEKGNCLEQPAEAANSTFKDRIHTTAYPVQAMGGLLWTYMGPGEAPQLPRWDYFVEENCIRQIGFTVVPANWLQIMENSMDPIHLEWLHMYYGQYIRTGKNKTDLGGFPQRRHAKIGFDMFEYGLRKRRYYEGGSEADSEWKDGHPVLFPNTLNQGRSMQIRVPIDNTTTRAWWFECYHFNNIDVPVQEEVPVYEFPRLDENGEFLLEEVWHQDMMAWVTQGPIADRTVEHVGASDRGVLFYRKALQEQMLAVEEGRDPLGIIREAHDIIRLPREEESFWYGSEPAEIAENMSRGLKYSPIRELLIDLTIKNLAAKKVETA